MLRSSSRMYNTGSMNDWIFAYSMQTSTNLEINLYHILTVGRTSFSQPLTLYDLFNFFLIFIIKSNNKITEHRAIFQRKRKNSEVNKQTKSVNNRKTGKTAMALTWYKHFQRNGGLNQILRRQTSRLHYG
jgi:hypothetical protein